jgi:hypothetical protein
MNAQLHEEIRALRGLLSTAIGVWAEAGDWPFEWCRTDACADVMVKPSRYLESGGAGHVTLRYNIGTGRLVLAKTPNQGESRVIFDATSSEHKRVYYGCSRLLEGEFEQRMLKLATEIVIVASHMAGSWINLNKPYPRGATKLRAVIVLGSDDDDRGHHDTLHMVAHLAVTLARLQAKLPTVMWVFSNNQTTVGKPGRHDGKICDETTQSCTPPMHIVLDADVHASKTTDWLLKREVRIQNSRQPLCPIEINEGIGVTILSTGGDAAYWAGILIGRGRQFVALGVPRRRVTEGAHAAPYHADMRFRRRLLRCHTRPAHTLQCVDLGRRSKNRRRLCSVNVKKPWRGPKEATPCFG